MAMTTLTPPAAMASPAAEELPGSDPGTILALDLATRRALALARAAELDPPQALPVRRRCGNEGSDRDDEQPALHPQLRRYSRTAPAVNRDRRPR